MNKLNVSFFYILFITMFSCSGMEQQNIVKLSKNARTLSKYAYSQDTNKNRDACQERYKNALNNFNDNTIQLTTNITDKKALWEIIESLESIKKEIFFIVDTINNQDKTNNIKHFRIEYIESVLKRLGDTANPLTTIEIRKYKQAIDNITSFSTYKNQNHQQSPQELLAASDIELQKDLKLLQQRKRSLSRQLAQERLAQENAKNNSTVQLIDNTIASLYKTPEEWTELRKTVNKVNEFIEEEKKENIQNKEQQELVNQKTQHSLISTPEQMSPEQKQQAKELLEKRRKEDEKSELKKLQQKQISSEKIKTNKLQQKTELPIDQPENEQPRFTPERITGIYPIWKAFGVIGLAAIIIYYCDLHSKCIAWFNHA